MIITDCFWEKENIGKRTVEVAVEREDELDMSLLKDLIQQYEYVVVKVPMCMPDFNIALCKLGFSIIEVQMNVSAVVKGYDWSRIYIDYDEVSFEDIKMKPELKLILEQITDDMFSTDRIVLDPVFGPAKGWNRYKNWIVNEFTAGKSKVSRVSYKNENVGFMMYRIEDAEFKLLLNGLFKKWQGKHIGIITPASPLLYAKGNKEIELVKTSISSNNIPAVKLYNRMGYMIDNQSYVFVKHNSNNN